MRKVKMEHRTGYVIELYVSRTGQEAQIYANGNLRRHIEGPDALDRAMKQYDGEIEYLDQLMQLREYKSGQKKI